MPRVSPRVPVLVTALSLAGLVVGIAVVAAGVAPGFVVQTIAGHAFGSAAPLTLPYVLASGALAFAGVVSSYNIGLHRYAFAVAAALVADAEIVAFAWFLPALQAAVTILAAGHVLVLAATFLSVRVRARASRGDEIVLTWTRWRRWRTGARATRCSRRWRTCIRWCSVSGARSRRCA